MQENRALFPTEREAFGSFTTLFSPYSATEWGNPSLPFPGSQPPPHPVHRSPSKKKYSAPGKPVGNDGDWSPAHLKGATLEKAAPEQLKSQGRGRVFGYPLHKAFPPPPASRVGYPASVLPIVPAPFSPTPSSPTENRFCFLSVSPL